MVALIPREDHRLPYGRGSVTLFKTCGRLLKHAAGHNGFISPNMVGINSDTVG
jgi:hypothetical protein